MTAIDRFVSQIHANRWHRYFYLCCRVLLAYAFLVAGLVKIVGDRFASGLSEIHPMGAFLTALLQTGLYYRFIGWCQVVAAILILVPRTVAMGAALYFPIILNICVLSISVRFEGSIVTTPLMVLANVYLLVWNQPKFKPLFSLKSSTPVPLTVRTKSLDSNFPMGFFLGVAASALCVLLLAQKGCGIMPRNSLQDCLLQYQGTPYEASAVEFCKCVHSEGRGLDPCLDQFEMRESRLDSPLD